MKLLGGLLCLAAAASAEFEKDEGVLVLGNDDFDAAVKAHDFLLAEFYAPWCGHCKALAPEFVKAAAALAEHENIAVAKIDATIHGELAQKYGVKGYPTLKWFKKDPENALEYGGGRQEPEISNWVLKKSGPPATTIADVDAAKAFKDSADVVVVGYFTGDNSAYIAAAGSIDDIPFGITDNADVAKELDIADGGVKLFKKFDEGFNDWDGEADIAKFAKDNSLAYVTEFSDKTAPKIFGGDIKKHMLFFGAKSGKDFEGQLAGFTESAKGHKGEVLFVLIDCDKSDNARVMEFFGLKEEDCPDVRMIEMGTTMKKFKPTADNLDKAGFDAFAAGVLDGSIARHLMSEAVPETNAEPVTYLVGTQFDELVKNNRDKAVFVEFYAPWCGHCKQLAPVWDKVGEHFKDNDDIIIAKSDATANEFDGIEVQGFPTIKYFPKGEYQVVDYNGGRDEETLIKYVENEGKEVEEEEDDEDDDEDEQEIEEEEEDNEPAAKDEL